MRKILIPMLAAFLALSTGARAQSSFVSPPYPYPVPYFAWADPSNPTATNNMLIQAIDNILAPLQPQVQGATSFISLIPGTTAGTIGLQPGAPANASIKIQPNGNGNIVLFTATENEQSRGLIKIGNQPSWAPKSTKRPGSPVSAARVQASSTRMVSRGSHTRWLTIVSLTASRAGQ